MHCNYVISLNLGIDPRIRCSAYDDIVGINCDVDPWIIDFNGVEVQMPLRIPHISWRGLIECILGIKSCGRSAEVYKLRRITIALYGELTTTTAMRAMYEVYTRGGRTDRAVYAYRYAKAIKSLSSLVFS